VIQKTQHIHNILKVVGFLLLVVDSRAQSAENELNNYAEKRYNLNKKGMIVLTTWASANIISGSAYFITGSKEEKYFYAMNAAWGVINLSIAVPGLSGKKQGYSSKEKLYKDQLKTEKIFAVNAVLDVLYIGGGFGLKEVAKNQSDMNKKAMFSGFGNSFLLQGAGLLAFDITMWTLNRKNRKKHLSRLMNNTEISLNPSRICLRWKF
jgi:hypothetical protein